MLGQNWVVFPIQQRRGALNKNIGSVDRIVRIIVGLGLISIVFVGPQTPWGWIGVVPLATALVSWCPLYTLLGINTCAGKGSGNKTSAK
jgi:hypothetical protein